MAVEHKTWPVAKFFFRVQIDGTQISFQAVDGLESEISIIEYRGGDYALWSKIKCPGMITYSNVTLKKGMFKGDTFLHDWWKSYETNHSHKGRRTVVIELMDTIADDKHTVCMTWTLKNAFVVKYTPTAMDAEADSEPAIEEMEIAYEDMDMEFG
jgi:phage tail-like protein